MQESQPVKQKTFFSKLHRRFCDCRTPASV